MPRALRILFLGLNVPFPPTNGHQLRNWSLLKALAREGHAVVLVSFAEAPPATEHVAALRAICADVEVVPAPSNGHSRQAWARLSALASPMPYGAWRLRSRAMQEAVARRLAGEAPDAVICDDIYMVHNLPAGVGRPVLLNKHDITHVIVRRYLERQRNPLVRAYGSLEYRKLRRWELEAGRRLAGVLACSEHDRRILQAHCPGLRVAVAPNVIDTADYPPCPVGEDGRVVYVGAMDWYPNQDAVEFFLTDILPRLRRRAAEVRFVVAGRNPSEAFRRGFRRLGDVDFTGSVPDIRREIARAAVCVVPLRIGSGTRLKILEAGAMEKPVVSTTLGAEGLEFAPGREIVLADEPEPFAEEVAGLLRDPGRRRALGAAARRRVEARYSLPVLQAAVARALDELLGPGALR